MNPTALAEQATLGTLLVDPAQIATVQGLLRPADFLTTWHRNIYAAILTRAGNHQTITPQAIHADLVAAGHPDERTRVVRLVSLVEVPPPRPKAARYASTVLEASLRRQVRDLGLLLRAGAVVATVDTASPDAAASGPFAEIDAQLRDARKRWDAATSGAIGNPRTPNVADLDAADAHRLEVAVSAARLVDAVPPPDAEQTRRAELDVLASVLADPAQLASVRARISPSLFTDPAHVATFAAICDLADLGEPIDTVAVCWATQREQCLRGKGLDADTVLRLAANPPAGDPAHAASVMAACATRAVADRSAAQLAEVANHPGIDVADVLDTARSHVAAVRRAVAGPTRPRPGSWSRPRHLHLVGPTAGAATAGRAL